MVGYSKGAKPPFTARRGLRKSMQESIVQVHSMVTPCPDRSHTRRELFLIGLLEALPVCPMAPLVFIDFLRQPRRRPRGASCRLRGGSARQMGSRAVYWTSSNLQGCILSAPARVVGAADKLDSGCQSHFDGKAWRLCRRLARWRQARKLKTAASSGYPRRCPPRRRFEFSPTFWLARHTVSRMAPGASRGRPRAR